MTQEVQGNKRPDKKVVTGEAFTEEQLLAFIPQQREDSVACFLTLQRAYRSLPIDAFTDFLVLWQQRAYEVNPINVEGESFLQHLQKHSNQLEYAQALQLYID